MGVGDDFLRFRSAYNIDRDTISSISRRYRRITRQLNRDFWGIESETANSLYVGSYGRDTAAFGVSDLDVGFKLPISLLGQYDARLVNGQSALLQAVKRSIQSTYSASDSFGDGQVVVVAFTDGITFEILPYFERSGGGWHYPNANAGGSWKTCNPRVEIAEIKAANQDTNHNLKYLCRMMRLWRDYWSVPMGGMLIDTLAYQFILSWPHSDKAFSFHDWMARDFFAFLANQREDQVFWRAPGSNAIVRPTGRFDYKSRQAHRLALQAIEADNKGYHGLRRQRWRQIFGPAFPRFGVI